MFRTFASGRGSARRGSDTRSLRRAAVALLTASLVCVPTGAATAVGTTSSAATASGTAPSTTSPLSWVPPTLTNPTTVVVSASKRNLKLDDTKDYVVEMPATALKGLHGLQIHGGHNVVLVGGQVELPVEAITSSTHAGRGLYIHGQTGTVHVEGLHLTGPGLEDGINIDAPKAVVQLQNIRVDLAHGSYSAHHADVLQVWNGPKELRIDGLTGYTEYQGFFLLPTQYGAAQPQRFDIRRTDLHGTPNSAYMMWRDSLAWPLKVTDVYVAPKNPLNRDSFLWPKGAGQGTAAWPSVTVGSPAAGEFVPASKVGLSYRSPGYAAAATTTDPAQGGVVESVVAPPVGALEAVTPVPGGLRVTGWAADADTTGPVSVDITAAGTARRVAADQPRADVGQGTGLTGKTGFDTVVPLPVGTHHVCVTALNVGSGADTALGCLSATVVDTTAPTITAGPTLSLRGGTVSPTGVVPVTAAWSVTDDVSVSETRLTSPVTATYSAGVSTADHVVGAGTSTWALHATDTAGNTGTAASDVAVTLVPETTATRDNYWWTRHGTGFLGGASLCSNRNGASLSHTFTGRSVSWVASKESAGGLADVYVDGVKEATIDLASSSRKAADRSVVFTRSWSTPGAHTIKVVVALGGKDKQVTSDGFVTVD